MCTAPQGATKSVSYFHREISRAVAPFIAAKKVRVFLAVNINHPCYSGQSIDIVLAMTT